MNKKNFVSEITWLKNILIKQIIKNINEIFYQVDSNIDQSHDDNFVHFYIDTLAHNSCHNSFLDSVLHTFYHDNLIIIILLKDIHIINIFYWLLKLQNKFFIFLSANFEGKISHFAFWLQNASNLKHRVFVRKF